MHLVSWEDVCKPKSHGGLGLRKAKEINHSLLAKLGWELLYNEDKLWVRTIQAKYMKNGSEKHKSCSSHIWRSIKQMQNFLQEGTAWSLGSGEKVKFWTDKWLEDMPLQNLALRVVPASELQKRVSAYWLPEGGWDLAQLGHLLSTEMLEKLCVYFPDRDSQHSDTSRWLHSPSGIFTCKSAMTALLPSPPVDSKSWTRNWKIKGPYRRCHFIWLLRRNRLLTNSSKFNRGLTLSPNCSVCTLQIEESSLHAIRDCDWAAAIWKHFLRPELTPDFFSLNLHDWVDYNLVQSCGQAPWEDNWASYFAEIADFIWKKRNEMTHSHTILNWQQSFDTLQHRLHMLQTSLSTEGIKTGAANLIGWERPSAGWISINVDGASSINSHASVGGLARNSNGEWISGFSGKIGRCESLHAEIWAIYHGLVLASKLGAKHVQLYSDSEEAIGAINNATAAHPLFMLINSIRTLLHSSEEIQLLPCLREANVPADLLAKSGLSRRTLCHFDHCPEEYLQSVLDDRFGRKRLRLS